MIREDRRERAAQRAARRFEKDAHETLNSKRGGRAVPIAREKFRFAANVKRMLTKKSPAG